jgi:hypothetical protein
MNVITGLGIPVDIVMPQVTQDIVWILFVFNCAKYSKIHLIYQIYNDSYSHQTISNNKNCCDHDKHFIVRHSTLKITHTNKIQTISCVTCGLTYLNRTQ